MEITNLVTSPFGIGEQLILELLRKKETVFTIFSSPKDVPMSFLGKMNLKYGFVKFDREMNIVKSLPRKVTNVFHLYETYTGPFTKMFISNSCATLLLLDWAKKTGTKKFIYLSSGEVYGQGRNLDEKRPNNPRSFYATTKYEAELLVRYYHKALSINSIRIFFPFGKNLNQGYISDLHQAIKQGDKVETEYDVISPTFINDVIEPLIKLRGTKESRIYNICGSPVTVDDLIDKIKNICARAPGKITIGKTELIGNSTKARQVLGYHETSLNDALESSFGA